MTPAIPRDASSLLVLRDVDEGLQLYMVRRHPRSQFLANALVFVGGRHDDEDRDGALQARCDGLAPGEAAARLGHGVAPERAVGLYISAIRECFEEAGLLLATGEGGAEVVQDSELIQQRQALNGGELTFLGLLQARGLRLPLLRLGYLDHWLTPEFEPRRYDTHFFVARAPAGQEATFDPKETSFGAWFTVAEVLQKSRANEVSLAPPTLTILEGLSGVRSVEAALARCPEQPLPAMMPKPLMERTPQPVLLLPGDHRYDDPASAKGAEHYVTLEDGHWVRVDGRG
jgi:8-oxo-dGTP pyrophosphatase MutT (NUDIX family)